MPPDITVIRPKSRDYPSSLRNKKAHEFFPRIWALGDLKILEKPLLGFFCSVKCPGDLILRTYDLARVLREEGIPVISGFHSPIEKDCLDLLLRGTQPMVLCPARNIEKMRITKLLKGPVQGGRLLIISPFTEKIRRLTVQTSQKRNQFVVSLASSVFVSHAEAGGKMDVFCREIFYSGKPLYTFDSNYNRSIIDIGATPVNQESLAEWASSFSVHNMGISEE